MLLKNWLVKIPEGEALESNLEKDGEEFDYHQTLLNIGYQWWQNEEQTKRVNYGDMINYISDTYGEVFAGLILIGKYNQQVGNNGNFGYYNNGYADGIGGCNSERDFEHPLHRRMILCMKNIIEGLDFKDYPEDEKILIEVNTILREFLKIPIDTDEFIYEQEFIKDEEDEEDLGHWDDCEVENLEYGQMDSDAANALDKRYYDVSTRAMEILEKISKNLIVNKKLSLEN